MLGRIRHLAQFPVPSAPLLLVAATTAALIGAGPAAAKKTAKKRAPVASAKLFNVPTGNAGLTDIVSGPGGALWATEKDADKLARIATNGRITEYPIDVDDYLGDRLENPRELVASGGSLYALMDGGYILRFNPADPAHPAVFYDPPGWEWPDRLAPGPGGGIWFGDDIDERVERLSADGTASTYSADIGDGPFVAGPGGSLWFSASGDSDTAYIREITASGKTGSIAVGRPGLEYIESIAFDRHGTLWFSKYEPGSWIIPATGGTLGWVDGGGHAHQIDMGGDYLPDSLTLGPDGAMWFTTKQGIGRITTGAHKRQSLWSLAPYDAAELAFGPDGKIWMIDPGANRVGRIGVLRAPRLATPRQRLRKAAKRRVLRVRCRMSAAGRCKVVAEVKAGKARRIGLTRHRRGTIVLARGSKKFKHKGRHTVRLKLSRRKARALRRTRRLTVSLTATATARHALPATATKKLRLKR